MGWKYYSISTSTWGDKVRLFPTQFTGGRALNTGSSGMATFHGRDVQVAGPITIDTIRPLERVLVAEWDGNAVYAGFIQSITEDLDAGTITVNHTDIWWLWKFRYLLHVHGNGAQTATPVTFSNLTLASIANRIVAKGLDAEPAARYDLPLIFTADVAGTDSRSYEGFKFPRVDYTLQEVIDTEGGPDVEFDNRWALGVETIEWVMRSGDLTSGFWEWDATAPMTDVRRLKLTTDASKVSNKFIGTGEGSGNKMLVRDASAFTGTAPALERVESFSAIKDGGELQARANAEVNAKNGPTQQLSFQIPVTGAVKVGELILGGTARVKSSGLYFLSAGQHDWRLIQFTFDRDWITMQFQEIGG